MQTKQIVTWAVIALVVATIATIPTHVFAQERKQVIYQTIVEFYQKHNAHNTQPPAPEIIIALTKKILEEEEFSGHIFTTAEIEEKATAELIMRALYS